MDWGPCGPMGWGKVLGERISKPHVRLSWPWEIGGKGTSHLWEHLSLTSFFQNYGFGMHRKRGREPGTFTRGLFYAESGKIGVFHIARDFWCLRGLFLPSSGWRKERFRTKITAEMTFGKKKSRVKANDLFWEFWNLLLFFFYLTELLRLILARRIK